jgi:hypothetical protein
MAGLGKGAHRATEPASAYTGIARECQVNKGKNESDIGHLEFFGFDVDMALGTHLDRTCTTTQGARTAADTNEDTGIDPRAGISPTVTNAL